METISQKIADHASHTTMRNFWGHQPHRFFCISGDTDYNPTKTLHWCNSAKKALLLATYFRQKNFTVTILLDGVNDSYVVLA